MEATDYMARTDAALAELGWAGSVRSAPGVDKDPAYCFGVVASVPERIAWRAFQVAGLDVACFACWSRAARNRKRTDCLEWGRRFLEDCGRDLDDAL